MELPQVFVETWAHEAEWLAALPQLVDECSEAWGLELEAPIDTPYSLVVPAGDAVLKLNAPSHFEAATEGDALERWGGRGAVRLVARDDERRALLIERCEPGTTLWGSVDRGDADELDVMSELLPRLRQRVDDPHPFRLLADEAERWTDELPTRYALTGAPFERSLLDFALDVYADVDRAASDLVNPDLHGLNVLRAAREPWLVIDPKPLVGEPELSGVGLVRNAAAGRQPGPSVEGWLDALSDLGFDRERARRWAVAHTLAWSWEESRSEWFPAHVENARRILRAR
jgi:streptomycin 6-kinase